MDFKDVFTFDKWLQVYLVFTVIDIFTGILKAYKVEGFKSRKMADGAIRIVSELVAMTFAGILDLLFSVNILMLATKSLFVFKQALSIVENLGMLGVSLPKELTDKIADLNPNKNKKPTEDEEAKLAIDNSNEEAKELAKKFQQMSQDEIDEFFKGIKK